MSRPSTGFLRASQGLRERKGHGHEARLFALLKCLPSAKRQAMLAERFSQSQRLALERWMMAEKASPSCRKSAWKGGCRRKGRPPRSGVPGLHIHRRVRKTFYRASVVAGPFRLSSGLTTKLEKAQDFLQVLHRIKARVTRTTKAGFPSSDELDALEASFKSAVEEEMASMGALRSEMQLNFYAKVPASYWIGQALSTPHFRALGGLEEGLSAWRSLTQARAAVFQGRTNRYTILRQHQPSDMEAAWRQLRQRHLDVWSAAGRCRKQAAARLAALEAKHHPYRQRMLQRWTARQDEAGLQHAIEEILQGWSPEKQLVTRVARSRGQGT